MGKHVEVKRVALNALVHPETLADIKREAKARGISQGAAIDLAFRTLRLSTAQGRVEPVVSAPRSARSYASPEVVRELAVEYD
jgi:hypothetical protein